MGQNFTQNCQSDISTKNEEGISITYENGNFHIPSKIPFQVQSTYVKIQKAAYNFCQQNNVDLDFIPCINRIIAYRQQKVFLAAFNRLQEQQKQSFLEQINRIPQDQIDSFYHNFVNRTQKKYSSSKSGKNIFQMPELTIPKYINALDFTKQEESRFYQKGKSVIQSGQVALVLMCAGSSSRFENQDKFLYPLKLKQAPNLTILDILFIRLKNSIQNQNFPIIITCNEGNFKKIQNFFRQRNYYGFKRQKFRFMEVQCLPILDLCGKFCLDQKYKLIKRPYGTARTVSEILKQRNLTWLKQQDIKYLHFVGAENLLEHPCDSLMMGSMIENGKRIMTKCVATASQWQKLPRYAASKENRIFTKYWSQLSSQLDKLQLQSAYKLPVATNSLVIQLSYLEELVKDVYTDIYLSQNYHVIRKKQKMLSLSTKKMVTAQSLTFEDDIRDILACCKNPGLLFIDRNHNYAPILSKSEQYSLEGTVENYQQTLTQQFKKCKKLHSYINKFKN